MGKKHFRREPSLRHPARVRVLEVFLMESDGGLAVISKWHPHLEESMNAVERVALSSALGSVAQVLGDFTEREFAGDGSAVNLQA